MKTILVALNAKFVHSNLAIRYIKEYSSMYDIELFETTINDSWQEAALQLAEKSPNVVGFSCYLWNIEIALRIGAILKELLPSVKIVLGGPEVSFDPKECMKQHSQVDFVVSGEGELVFHQLLKTISNGEEGYDVINGLSFRRSGEIQQNPATKPLRNLDELPFPYKNGMPGKILYYEASRGCPFSCSYCLSGSMGAIRFFGIERVKADLKKLIQSKVELVKFVDRTFNANKNFALEIWRYLIENAADTCFHFEIAADLLDEQSIKLLATAPKGLFQFEIGVQTTNTAVLERINRSMDFQKVSEKLLQLQSNGNIHCHLDLIAGLPGEGLNSFIQSFEDVWHLSQMCCSLDFSRCSRELRFIAI